ncbi:MAG: CRTAC1 family protein [Planctomycetaceae bacterium]|nr:CRTAC1 family protein [Planctomycetaceae bacterium]
MCRYYGTASDGSSFAVAVVIHVPQNEGLSLTPSDSWAAWWLLLRQVVIAIVFLASAGGCDSSPHPGQAVPRTVQPSTDAGANGTEVLTSSRATAESPADMKLHAGGIRLVETTAIQGIHWRHEVGDVAEFPMPQIMGSGCGLVDINGDGRLDILLMGGVSGSAPESSASSTGGRCALFLQQEDGSFKDETPSAGLQAKGFGMGVSVGDIDNDGDSDLLLTSSLGASLFVSDRDGHFVDVTDQAGIEAPRWCTASAFFDFDADGWLDVLVVNYADYFPGSQCQDATGRRDYCGPQAFQGTTDQLFRNLGGDGKPGTFEDVTVPSGLAGATGKGLGTLCCDLTGDGLADIYVANDMEPNRLWVAQADGTFRDEADLRGCAVDLHGRPQASMGTGFADLTGDRRPDLFLTHLRGETNTVYQDLGHGVYADQTPRTGLAAPSLNMTGFGTFLGDLNLDGRVDVLVVNGKVMRAPLLNPGIGLTHWEEYAERNQVFLQTSPGHFEETRDEGDFGREVEASRGLAVGDIDHDGDLDVLVTSAAAPARLFRNDSVRKGHWLSVRAYDPERRRDSIGALVTVDADGVRDSRIVLPQCGYLSQQDSCVHFGLGQRGTVSVEVQWPDGIRETQRVDAVSADSAIEIRRGTDGATVLFHAAVQSAAGLPADFGKDD